MRIAYLVRAGDNPDHFERLVRALDSATSTIFVHVDAHRPLEEFSVKAPPNCRFLHERISTIAGQYSSVEVALRLMCGALDADATLQRFVLLSDCDYPVHGRRWIESFFEEFSDQEFIDAFAMNERMGEASLRLNPRNPDSGQTSKTAARMRPLSYLSGTNQIYKRWLGALRPYKGDGTWALTRAACDYVRAFVERRTELIGFFKQIQRPSEIVFPTILANSPFSRRLCGGLMFSDWSGDGDGPVELSDRQLPRLAKPGCAWTGLPLFARPFPADSERLVARIREMTENEAATARFPAGFFFMRRLLTQGHERNLRQHGEISPRRFYVLDERKLVYLSVPKAACTAIKSALGKAIGLEFARHDIQRYHSHDRWNIRTGSLTESQKKYFRFTFTRDPFARLVSCYCDKILLTSDAGHREEYYDRYIFALPAQLSFAEFAERVSRIPDPLADPHFRSQYALLYREGELQVDFVGKIEELDRQWKPIADQYDLDPTLERMNVTRANVDQFDYRLLYTEPLVRLVHERYRQDVEMLGYQSEYESLLNSVCAFQA